MRTLIIDTNAGRFYLKQDTGGYDLVGRQADASLLNEEEVDTFLTELDKPMNEWAPTMRRVTLMFLRTNVRSINAH